MSIQYNSKAEEKSLFRAKTADGDSRRHQWRRLKECQNMRWKAISKSHGTPSDGAKWDLAPSLSLTLSDTVGNCLGRLWFEGVQKLQFPLGENLDSALVASSQTTGWLGRCLHTLFQLIISCNVRGKNRNKIFSFASQGSRAIPTELPLNSNGHTQCRCLFELTINSSNLQQMGLCAMCVRRAR